MLDDGQIFVEGNQYNKTYRNISLPLKEKQLKKHQLVKYINFRDFPTLTLEEHKDMRQ